LGQSALRLGTLRDTGYGWWIERLRSNLRRFDAIRLDHFIGFHRYWEIPTRSPSAREGHFVEAPGHDFSAVCAKRWVTCRSSPKIWAS
jgi:4-alpha-glucanotransferase